MIAILLSACTTTSGTAVGEPVPDFSLEDRNPGSSRYGDLVTPGDYESQVSAWYFGHAT